MQGCRLAAHAPGLRHTSQQAAQLSARDVRGRGSGTSVNSALIGALAASIGVPIAFLVLRRLFPVPPGAQVDRSLEDLRKEYGRWELLTLPLFLGIAPVASYLWWKLFLGLEAETGFAYDGAVFALRPAPIAWLIPAMFLGMLSAGPAVDAVLRRLLKDRYREYVAYQNLRHGFDSEAMAKSFYLGFGGLVAVSVLMIGSWYAIFTTAEIRLNPFFGIRERTFSYAEVVSIKTAPTFVAPNGKTVQRREYVVQFSDSTSWSTNYDPSEATEAQVRSLVRAVSERSGVAVSEIPVLRREVFR